MEVSLAAKGGGSENKSKFYALNPSDSIVDWVVKTVPLMGAGWCPPGMLGIGIGGSAEKAMLLAKESIMAPVDIHELKAKAAEFAKTGAKLWKYEHRLPEGIMPCCDVINRGAALYKEMLSAGIPPEDARFVLPNATETKILVTMNARELHHFFALRLCRRAQWEIRQLMHAVRAAVEPGQGDGIGDGAPHRGDVPEQDRRALGVGTHDHEAQVFQRFDVALAAH